MMRVADDTRAGGDLGTAITLYRRVSELRPGDPRPLASLASTLAQAHSYTEAAEVYRRALGSPGQMEGELHRGLAMTLLGLNQPEGALEELRQAQGKAPQDARVYNAMGVTHDLMGRHDLAQQDYQGGLHIAPQSTGLRNNYGLSLALAGDYPAAVATLTELTLDANTSPRHRLNLALVYGLAGDERKAASIARTVLDEEAVRSNLTYYAMLRGMDDKARANAIMGGNIVGNVTVAGGPAPRPGTEDASMAKAGAAPREPVESATLSEPKPVKHAHKVAKAKPKPTELAKTEPAASSAPATEPAASVPAASDPPAATTDPVKLAPNDSAPASSTADATPPAAPTAPSADAAAPAPATDTPPAPAAADSTTPSGKRLSGPAGFVVQVGSFASEANAKKLADQLNQKGYGMAVVHHRDASGRDWYAVRAGGYASADEAAAAARHMHDAEQVPAVVVHDRGRGQA